MLFLLLLFDKVFWIKSGYPTLNSPPDLTPPGTPRGKFKVLVHKPTRKDSPKISNDQPVSPKGSIKDINIEDFKKDVNEVCATILQDVLAGEVRNL